MVGAMAMFAIEDAFLKVASQTMPIGQVLLHFGIGGVVVFAILARLSQDPLNHPDVLSRPMRIRFGFEVFGRLFYVLAIALTPLSSATVILQATPVVVVAGAAIFFDESVGWRRWVAVFLGLAGVCVIIQPGTDDFSILSVLAVLGMLGFAGRDLASRAAPKTLSTNLLGFYGFCAIIVAGVGYMLWEQTPPVLPNAQTSTAISGAALSGVVAYIALMKAMRTGEVASVTPFRYSRLLFGVALGVLVFGETLPRETIFGATLILASGAIIMWRTHSASSHHGN